MSNPVSRSLTPGHPTRQQLDELDALMQRMLALPVSPSDGEPEPSPVEDSLLRAVVSSPAPLAETPPTPDFTAALPAPLAPPIEPTPPTIEEPPPRTSEQRPQIAAWVRPLLWSNRVFDRGTVRFGAPGRWLRGPGGRAWLGGVGLGLLATAVAWGVLDWMGWPW